VAAAGKVAVIGYCWGGTIAWMTASRLPGFACAVAYYGGGILDAAAEKSRCPVMAHFGERDSGIPIAGVRELIVKRPDVQVFVYPADHGFNCEQRAAYDLASAKLARERTLEFLRRHVG
jgi:carboxymethylenebutenolidase